MTSAWKAMAVLALLLAAFALLAAVFLVSQIQQQRREFIALVCDHNRVLVTFIAAPPDLPRDRPALERLKRERCDKLLEDVGAPPLP